MRNEGRVRGRGFERRKRKGDVEMPRVLRSRTHRNRRAARTVPARFNRNRTRLERVHDDDFFKAGRNPNVQVERHYLGPMNNVCLNCGARHFHCEGSSDNGTLFTQCCDKGKFKLPEYCESVLIEQLLENRHNASANFQITFDRGMLPLQWLVLVYKVRNKRVVGHIF